MSTIPTGFSVAELTKVSYSNLNSKAKESFNFHEIAAALAQHGYNSLRLDDDWNGADFISVPDSPDKPTLYVQLKSRATISKKYLGFQELFIAFPADAKDPEDSDARSWYLILHSDLVSVFENHSSTPGTINWRPDKNDYDRDTLSVALRADLEKYRIA